MIEDTIQFGSKSIRYQLFYSQRKTLGITVSPDMTVQVKAPIGSKKEKIEKKIKKKAPWILNQQSFFLSFHPRSLPYLYVSGESHLYAGKRYRLKIIDSKYNSVKLKGAFIEIRTNGNLSVKQMLDNWYLKLAKIKFGKIAKPLIETFKKYDVVPSSLVIRSMSLRWGSCTAKGKIILNPELIKAPKPCIEYVIIHELCHLIYHDHTSNFFKLQTKEMPDWKKWKDKLEQLLA